MGYRLKTQNIWSCAIICLLIIASGQTSAAAPILTLSTTAEEPLYSENENGFLNELLGAVLGDIGYRLETTRLPAQRGLVFSNSGKFDGEMIRAKEIEDLFPNLRRVPEKIIDIEFVVFSNEPNKERIRWNDFKNRSVTIVTGWKIIESSVPNSAELTKVENAQQLFYLLEKKRTDYVVYERWGGQHLLSQYHFDWVNPHLPALLATPMYMYLHKKHENLVPLVNRAIMQLKRDGRYEKLVRKHLQADFKYKGAPEQ